MTQRLRLAVAVVAVVVVAAHVRASQIADCDDSRPTVVRVGIPRERGNPRTTDLTVAALRSLYRDPCGTRPLDIQLAFGSDYQMLEWLESDAIDAAILTDFSLYTLGGARQLAELRAPLGEGPPVLPRVAYVATRQNGGWLRREVRDEYTRFLDDLWNGRPRNATLALASHLSTTGFLEPVTIAARHFERKLAALEEGRDEKREHLWKEFFAATRFTLDCDTFDRCLDVVARDRAKLADNATILFFPGEEVLEREGLPPTRDGAREHLVMSRQRAHDLFFGTLPTGTQFADVEAQPLDAAMLATLEHPPAALRHAIEPEPLYGTRIYGFTPDESLRLLRQQQRRSNEDELALVLPGGGVKAAYQTGIISPLYRDGKLWNDPREKSDDDALAVRTVIGTSGGALLGFFVSQLQRNEKIELVDILWMPRKEKLLGAHDVFGFTDLPQYVGVGVAFLIFCIILALFTSVAQPAFFTRAKVAQRSWRPRLIPIALLFLAAPMLVRAVIGGDAVEDVPVIEGIFYSMMAMLVMFADHCLVDRGPGRYESRPTRRLALTLLAAGSVMLFLGTRGGDLLEQHVTFGIAFITFATMFAGAPLLLLHLTRRAGNREHRLAEIVLSLLFVLLLLWLIAPPDWRYAPIVGFSSLIGLAIATYLYTRAQKSHRLVPPLLTTLTLLATAMLCWPRERDAESFSFSYLTAEALDISLAAFLTSTAIVLLLVAMAIWAARDERYVVDDVAPFFLGLAVALVHVGATLGTIFLVSKLSRGGVHSLEMTKSFWITLALAAMLFALLILQSKTLRKGVEFLAAEHRNGTLLPRRYARMLAVTSLGVLWWNFLIAPAIYGNRQAASYIAGTINRFYESRDARFAKDPAVHTFAPTARFIVTANLLERDGTNYFLFHPPGEEAEAASWQRDGAWWWTYPTRAAATNDPCGKVIGPRCRDFVRDVVIASGSPFPIFAAHKVMIPAKGEERPRWFVDGGYSNNIPVDAAKSVDAKQVLIVHSSNPLEGTGHDQAPSLVSWKPGRLVSNAQRLPGFLFERSQQVDRLSRQNLFVVALAPPLEDANDWPNLAQFDEATVDKMLTKSREHIDRRIGLVESWGLPRFESVRDGEPTATR